MAIGLFLLIIHKLIIVGLQGIFIFSISIDALKTVMLG